MRIFAIVATLIQIASASAADRKLASEEARCGTIKSISTREVRSEKTLGNLTSGVYVRLSNGQGYLMFDEKEQNRVPIVNSELLKLAFSTNSKICVNGISTFNSNFTSAEWVEVLK